VLPLLLEDVVPLLDDVLPLLLEEVLPELLEDAPFEEPVLPDELPLLDDPFVPERSRPVMAGPQAVSDRPTAMIHTHRSCMSIPLSRQQEATPDATMGAGEATEGGRGQTGSSLHQDGCS
jgi:hypothetical protein